MALLVVFASMGAEALQTGAKPPASLSIVSVTFVNHLAQALNVTIGAPPLGMPNSITLAPGATGQLAVNVLAPILVRDILLFQVNNTLYIDMASGQSGALGRLLAELGVLSIEVSAGPCASGQEGLTLMDYAAGVLINNAGCAVRQ